MSSHLVNDLERVCDHLVVLVDSQVRVIGEVEELLATHHRLSGPRRDVGTLPADQHVVSAKHTDRQTTVLVRTEAPILDPAWTVARIGLEDLVLEYMSNPRRRPSRPGGPPMTWLTWRQFRMPALSGSSPRWS